MARRLKAYKTSSGFFDLAVAAPSMKAAADAWGSRTNVFKQGLAKETRDPAIVAATMARPGVVLRRPVGSAGAFVEHAHLPKHLPAGKANHEAAKTRAERKAPPGKEIDHKAADAVAFEREQKRRETVRRKEEAARERRRKLREQAIAKAQSALDRATREHEQKVHQIEKDRAALDKRSQAEEIRWENQKKKVEAALQKAELD